MPTLSHSLLSLASLGLAVVTTGALAHGGGLDANGCHTDRRTGVYHCHRAPPAVVGGASPGALVRPDTPALTGQSRVAAPTLAAPSLTGSGLGSGPAAGYAATARPVGSRTCHVGPRGGTYTLTASGRKNYGGC